MSRDPHQEALMAAAERLGIEALPMPAAFGPDAVVYRRRGRRALVLEGRVYPELSVVADRLCALKPAMKALLAEHGVPTPMGFAFTDAHAPEVVARAADGARRPFVVKPVEGTHGDGVGLGLTDHEALVAWVRRHALVRTGWLVEDFVAGADLRLQVLGGEVIAACTRVPAAVVGDGRRTLRALVAERAVEVAARNPLNALVVDGETGALLARQGL
ncbi:MAG: hypothetical protein KC635_22230, partial [Myxococcales bacterium]|nr:hypothetical protein [Myxococcales bacterium]